MGGDLRKWLGALAMSVFAMLAVAAAPAQANVLDEAAQPGGSFSAEFAAPTPVPESYTTVIGSGTPNDHDFLVFEALRPGAQTLTLTIERDPASEQVRSSGGEVYFKQDAFGYAWDGIEAGKFRVNYGRPTATVEITLDSGFAGGRLYLAIYYTDGPRVLFEIAAPTNDSLPPPPPPPPPPGPGVFGPEDAPGGAFSTSWSAPTPIGAGYDAVEGEGRGGTRLFFVFTDLPPGAQTLTLEFSYPDTALPLYWAGGSVLAREGPFRWEWDGTPVGDFAISPLNRTQRMTLTTSTGFEGVLHVGLYFTYGSWVNFRIEVPSNAGPGGLPDIVARKTVRVIDERGQGCGTMDGIAVTGPQAAIPGACIEFTIAARNNGDGAATDIAIDDLLDPNLIFMGAEARGFDGPAAGADFLSPPGNTDCATGNCRIRLRNGHLAPGTGGHIVVRTLIK